MRYALRRGGGGPAPWRSGPAFVSATVALLALAAPALAQTAGPIKPPPAKTQPPSSDDEDEATVQSITVAAQKAAPQPGAVVGDIKPELQLAPADIQSYGVSSVTELLTELAPQIRSDRGRGGEPPVVLLNGRRISSFAEIQNIPTEAILRVDILPEEVALKYGYTANQRVVNIVLRRRFRAITGELEGGGATEGGAANGQAEANLLHLRGDARLNLDLKYHASAALTEADRPLVSIASGEPFDLTGNVLSTTPGGQIDPALSALVGRPVTIAGVPAGAPASGPTLADFVPTAGVANVTDVRADRTLTPETQQVTANAVWAAPIFGGLRATLNATLGASSSDTLQGLPSLGLIVPAGDPFSPFGSDVMVDRYVSGFGPLHQRADSWTAHLGSTLNRDFGEWRLSLNDAYDHADSQTTSDAGVDPAPLQTLLAGRSATFNPFAPFPSGLPSLLPQNRAHSISDSATVQFLANGPALKLPAGELYVSAKIGDTQSWLNSTSQRLGFTQALGASHNDANAQLNFDLPLTSRAHHVLGFVGDLSVNGNIAVDELSDFGLLTTVGYGVNWTPLTGVGIIVSHTTDHAAPSTAQLAGPILATPGVRIFDYATGQTVDVTLITGGNPSLTKDTRNVTKIGLTLKPIASQNLNITVSYIASRIDNPLATLPAADAAIEAAFPSRFIRDASGQLIEEDDRPLNFARQDRQEIRWGFNYSRPIGPQPRPPAGRFGGGGQRRRPDGSVAPGGPDGGGPPGPDAPAASPADAFPAGGPPDGGGGPRGPGGGFGGFGGFAAGGRLQLALYHTVIFVDRILVAPGGPALDFLNGSPAGATGGQPRQEIEAQAGFTLKGFGARLSADWKSGTTVVGGFGPAGSLTFSDIGTINLRLFDNLGQQRSVVQRYRWLRGARVSLAINNLFDERQRVRDGTGATPVSYQGAYLDPVGRTVSLGFRKLFF
ncbi:MAG: TonB-dependent receptor [Caulobacterales bacterium]